MLRMSPLMSSAVIMIATRFITIHFFHAASGASASSTTTTAAAFSTAFSTRGECSSSAVVAPQSFVRSSLPRGPPGRCGRCGIRGASASSSAEPCHRTLKEGEAHSSEQVIKKSRFIGVAEHCESWGDARDFVERLRTDHPKARHVCFGFVSGGGSNNPVQERCSDDGEPTGTAGIPILGAIKGEGLSDTVCAVVRYYGGVKLGAGGLIRAYGGTARLVLREAPSEELIPRSTLRISASAANLGRVYDMVQRFGATAGEESYGSDGEAHMTIVCESSLLERMKEQLADVTRGDVKFLLDDDEETAN